MHSTRPWLRVKRSLIVLPVLTLCLFRAALSESIRGTVRDAWTGVPLVNATVSLFWQPGRNSELALAGREVTAFTATSHEGGVFQFDGIPPGSYAISAELPGYLDSDRSAEAGVRTVSVPSEHPGQTLAVRLDAAARVRGSVRPCDGRSLSSTRVRALVDLRGQLHQLAIAEVDRTGDFVLEQLQPQRYLLLAEPVTEPFAYPPTYFPSATTPDGAVPVDVRPGSRVAGIRIVPCPERSYRVGGRVATIPAAPAGGEAVYLAPLSQQGTTLLALARRVAPGVDGRFEFIGVASGSYVLRLVSERGDRRVLSSQPVFVGVQSLDNLTLYVEPPPSVRGRISVAGSPNRDLSSMRIALETVGLGVEAATSIETPVASDGRFAVRALEPVAYQIRVLAPPDLWVRSLLAEGREVPGGELRLDAGSQRRLEIQLRGGAAQIDGTVLGTARGQTSTATAAVLYPRHRSAKRQLPKAARVVGDRFRFGGIAPGRYRVLATEQFDPNLFADPVFLAHLAGAARAVDLQRSERRDLAVQIVSAGQLRTAARRAGLPLN